jgi:hypothetical protein
MIKVFFKKKKKKSIQYGKGFMIKVSVLCFLYFSFWKTLFKLASKKKKKKKKKKKLTKDLYVDHLSLLKILSTRKRKNFVAALELSTWPMETGTLNWLCQSHSQPTWRAVNKQYKCVLILINKYHIL